MPYIIGNVLYVLGMITTGLAIVFTAKIMVAYHDWKTYGEWEDHQRLTDWIGRAVMTGSAIGIAVWGVFRFENGVVYIASHLPDYEVSFVNMVVFHPTIDLSLVVLAMCVGIWIGFLSLPEYFR